MSSESFRLGTLGGEKLHNLCIHAIRLEKLGFQEMDDLERAKERIMRPDLRTIVFLDLDETLTAQNVAPSEYFRSGPRGLSDKEEVDRYMCHRVPKELRRRIKAFLKELDEKEDTDWFILTDNIYSMTRCTMRLAFKYDTPPGTILDRLIRADLDSAGDYISKSKTIQSLLTMRAEAGLSPVRVLFADNLEFHRKDTRDALQRFYGTSEQIDFKQSFKREMNMEDDEEPKNDDEELMDDNEEMFKVPYTICCGDLKEGLTDDHVEKMLEFVQN